MATYDPTEPINLMAELKAALNPPRTVYPLYLASRIELGLQAAQREADRIVASVGELQSLGNSRYVIPVTDTSGTKYWITVEVAS